MRMDLGQYNLKRGMTMKAGLLALAVVTVAACAPDLTTGSIGPQPADYREIVKAHVRATFFDPYSIRDAYISRPFPGGTVINSNMESGMGWVVCLKANAKNR